MGSTQWRSRTALPWGLIPAARRKPLTKVIACVEALGLSELLGARFPEPARLGGVDSA